MSWTDPEIDTARHFLLAMSDILKRSSLQIQSNETLDRGAMELVLTSVREMRTLQETTQRFLDFIQENNMAQGQMPADIHEQMSNAFSIREFNPRRPENSHER